MKVISKNPRYLSTSERRAVTVEAVVELASEQNPSDITTAAIAGKMGVTQGALFRHFPTKEAILEAVMAWAAERLLSRVDKAARGAATTVDALEGVFRAHVEFIVRHPGVPRVLFGELQRPGKTLPKRRARLLMRGYRERLARILEAGRAQGELDAGLNVNAAAVLFLGAIQGLMMQSLLAGDVARLREDAPRVFAIFLRGIGGRK